MVVITAAGQAVVDEIRADEARSLRAVAASLDSNDVEACLRVLTRLLETVRADATAEPAGTVD